MENKNFKWDLEKILEGNSLENLSYEYFQLLEELTKLYKQNIFASKERLLKFHEKDLEYTKVYNRLMNYLENKKNENLGDNSWFGHIQKIKNEAVEYMKEFSDFNLKVIEHKNEIKEFLRDEELSNLSRFYESIFRTEGHNYHEEAQKIMASYSVSSNSYERIFTTLKDKELPIKEAKDCKKQAHKILNYDDFLKTQTNPDRIFRKNAYYSWHKSINSYKETFANLLYFKILEQNINAKNRNFAGFIEEQTFNDELTPTLIPYIYRKVARFHPEYRKFHRIKKQKLKEVYQLKGIKPWDMRMAVIKSNDNISIEEAQKMVLEAFEIMGPEYVTNLKKAFEERWIDWNIREDKITGAYCISGCYGLANKYILMNYDFQLDGIYTLVHELGHAMHAVEFCKAQDVYAETTIFLAEIPSTLNEILFSLYLIDKYKDNPQKKFEIYHKLLENFFATTINQAILSAWEYEANKLVNEGRNLDAETAILIYKAKKEKYQGNRITKPLSNWNQISLASVLTIPHFYSGEFYVYKYIVGQVVSLLIAEEIYINKNQEFLKKYFEFLRVGTSLSNLEALKLLDINLERSATWTKIRDIIKGWIKEYTALAAMNSKKKAKSS